MKIAIIGTGNVGSAIARGLSETPHAVTLGARNPDAPNTKSLAEEAGAAIAPPGDAVADAEIIILALPWHAAKEAVLGLGSLVGKIVVDPMNPLGMVDGALGLALGFDTSGGEIVQKWLPDALVVKTLNQVGAEIMADNADLPVRPVMFLAGNDEAAKSTVGGVLTDLGFEALDSGDITKSRLLEPFAMTWINQALLRGKGRDWAFAAVGS